MRRRAAGLLAVLGAAGCATAPGTDVRALGRTLAPDGRPVSAQLAEAQGHFRLGNVALAAEGFRKALRAEPNSVDALNGLAACYDRLGRFDLSRSFYERALALAPDDARLYANLATSFALQGRTDEAAAVHRELGVRMSAGRAPTRAPVGAGGGAGSVPVGIAISGERASPSLPITALEAWVGRTSPVIPRGDPMKAVTAGRNGQASLPSAGAGPRLQRMSLAEVALVTTRSRPALAVEVPGTRARLSQTHESKVTGRSGAGAAGVRVTVLNAARVPKLAAQTRERLVQLGWRGVAIGNEAKARRQSVVAYSQPQRATAQRLARTLGIQAQVSRTVPDGLLLIIVGNDLAKRQPAA